MVLLLLAQDEGRFGRISEARRAWAPPGVRPICARQIVRESLYVFAALAPASGQLSALILPSCDAEAMSVFLAQVCADFAGQRVLMQLDGAGWHRAKALRLPENVAFIEQPAHSPELNPAEHLWDHLRTHALANRAFHSLDDVEEALCTHLLALQADPERVRSLCAFPWFKL